MKGLDFIKIALGHRLIPRKGQVLHVRCLNGREDWIPVQTIETDPIGMNINSGQLILTSNGGFLAKQQGESTSTGDIILSVEKASRCEQS